MAQVLYRKYRSQNFSELLGQENIIKVIQQAIKDDNVAHAYLFNGPRGTGKTSLARILAKALNCQNPKDGNPCNKCSNCLAINDAVFMDLIEIDAASNRGIDEIRELKEKLNFMPMEGAVKVYIIDEVHMLTTEAFNALLKTLEEPPEKVVFILATTEVHKLPQTIISRTQRFDFRLANEDELTNKLKYILKGEDIKVDDDALKLIAKAGSGSFRDAETILEKVLVSTSTSKKSVTLEEVTEILGFASDSLITDLFNYLIKADAREAIALIERAENAGVEMSQMLKQVLLKAREELTQTIQVGSGYYDLRFLYTLIKEMNEAIGLVKNSPVPTLPVELAILNIVGLSVAESGGKDVTKKLPKDKNEREDHDSGNGNSSAKPSPKPESKVLNKVVAKNANNDAELSMDEVETKWADVMELGKKENPHLAALLINAVVVEVVGGSVVLEVPFKFHQKQLENKKTQKYLSEITQEVFSKPVPIRVEVNEKLIKSAIEENNEEESNSTLVEGIFGELV